MKTSKLALETRGLFQSGTNAYIRTHPEALLPWYSSSCEIHTESHMCLGWKGCSEPQFLGEARSRLNSEQIVLSFFHTFLGNSFQCLVFLIEIFPLLYFKSVSHILIYEHYCHPAIMHLHKGFGSNFLVMLVVTSELFPLLSSFLVAQCFKAVWTQLLVFSASSKPCSCGCSVLCMEAKLWNQCCVTTASKYWVFKRKMSEH